MGTACHSLPTLPTSKAQPMGSCTSRPSCLLVHCSQLHCGLWPPPANPWTFASCLTSHTAGRLMELLPIIGMSSLFLSVCFGRGLRKGLTLGFSKTDKAAVGDFGCSDNVLCFSWLSQSRRNHPLDTCFSNSGSSSTFEKNLRMCHSLIWQSQNKASVWCYPVVLVLNRLFTFPEYKETG